MGTPNLRDYAVMVFERKSTGPGYLVTGLLIASLLPGLPWGSSRAFGQMAAACPNPTAFTAGLQGPLAHIRYLADDALEGREAGSAGARCAGDYIASYFRSLGLEPATPGDSYFQTFDVRMGSRLEEGNALTLSGRDFSAHTDWIPYGFSASGTVNGSLVYGGLGVSQPGADEDAYAHLDLEGRIVVVEGSDPRSAPGAPLAGDPHFKATVAAGRGAAAILILLPEGVSLPDPEAEMRPSTRIPAAAVAGASARAVRAAAEAGGEATIEVRLEPRMVEVRNVAALLPGSDPALAREVVIVGAHYDHLGFGGDGSLAPDSHEVHNGADDNASGTAAVMEVARHLAEGSAQPARSVLFLAFTGEEKGLWGSGHYIQQPLRPLQSTVAMLNMDMVGRLGDNTLTVYGTGSAVEWLSLLEEINGSRPEPFVISPIPDGFGPSDQSEFYGAGIPVLHFFTNTHAEYHRPEDDWQLINVQGLERVVELVTDATLELTGTAAAPAPTLTLVAGTRPTHGAAMAGDSSAAAAPSRGYGAYMGTIPDMTPQELGVRITGVREGSPAQKAGLQAGDVLVEMGGTEITDLYAYTYVLQAHKPGDEVSVVVLRNGERVTLKAVLGSRD